MSWIQTYTGKRFDINELREDSIVIEDIAHSLSQQARYNGHGSRFYSVAEHSAILAEWVLETTSDPIAAYTALMHDASEAYLSDIPSPFKPLLTNYEELEDRVSNVLSHVFGFDYPYPSIVEEADRRVILDEREALFETVRSDWEKSSLEPLGVTILAQSPEDARARFLKRFEELRVNI